MEGSLNVPYFTNNVKLYIVISNEDRYSLHFIKHVTNMDESRHILVSRYIQTCDMFYGTEGVQNGPIFTNGLLRMAPTFMNMKRKYLGTN
jgi:hypothetical protein